MYQIIINKLIKLVKRIYYLLNQIFQNKPNREPLHPSHQVSREPTKYVAVAY